MGPGWDFLSAQLITLYKGFQKVGVAKFIYVVPEPTGNIGSGGRGQGLGVVHQTFFHDFLCLQNHICVCQITAQTIKTWQSFAFSSGDSSFISSHLPALLNSNLRLGVTD